MNWQPIETAPKDGTDILAASGVSITTVRWNVICENWQLCEWGSWASGGEWNPTHWMPLPEPPESVPFRTSEA